MISAKSMTVVTMLAVAGTAVAQEKTDEQRIAELVNELTNEKYHRGALDELIGLGRKAKESLTEQLRAELRGRVLSTEVNEPNVLLDTTVSDLLDTTLSNRMTRIVEALAATTVPPEDVPDLFRALADLYPYSRFDRGVGIESARDLDEILHELSPDLAARILTEALRFMGRADSILFYHSPQWLLNAYVNDGRALARLLSAELLADRGPSARSALPALRKALTASHPKDLIVRPQDIVPSARLDPYSVGIEVSMDSEIHAAVARAMESIAGDDPSVAVAFAYRMLNDPLPAQRMDAAMTLGRFGPEAAEVVPQLREALGDAEMGVVAEAITALGTIGPAAKGAIPTLENLTEHEDRQIAERAKAALRQVRGR